MAAEYTKGRDWVSSAKLNYTHYFLKQLTGYTLHPSIDIKAQTCSVADLGTQTTIWAFDVAEQSSLSAEVDGFDVSNKFFPPSAWLPSNLKLHIHDICTPFPNEFIGKYDVVHLRMFILVSPMQLNQMLDNAIKLLKPGGYIQWTEHDKMNMEIYPPGTSTETMEALVKLQQNPYPSFDKSWQLGIAPTMATKGLEIVAQDRFQVRKSMLSQLGELRMLAFMDVPPGLSEVIDDFKKHHRESFLEENRKGIALVDGFICVVGRKPVGAGVK